MTPSKQMTKAWQAFLHPRVLFFIVGGTAVIFLTFFTTSNALEITISGIASVFIGIGVNNFTSLETRLKDERKLRSRRRHLLQVNEIAGDHLQRIADELGTGKNLSWDTEIKELQKIVALSIELIREDSSLD